MSGIPQATCSLRTSRCHSKDGDPPRADTRSLSLTSRTCLPGDEISRGSWTVSLAILRVSKLCPFSHGSSCLNMGLGVGKDLSIKAAFRSLQCTISRFCSKSEEIGPLDVTRSARDICIPLSASPTSSYHRKKGPQRSTKTETRSKRDDGVLAETSRTT
jgi:hypothetical protein